MAKNIVIAANDKSLTFADRLEALKVANHEAALKSRADFDTRLVNAVTKRANEVLDAITGG